MGVSDVAAVSFQFRGKIVKDAVKGAAEIDADVAMAARRTVDGKNDFSPANSGFLTVECHGQTLASSPPSRASPIERGAHCEG